MMKNKVLKYIKENRMIEAGETIIVGVSGGADSMCLLHILSMLREELKIELAVVHIHHGIRGLSADRDAAFVEEYCRREDIPFYLFRYDVPSLAKTWRMTCEEAGRKVRYEAFERVLQQLGQADGGKIAVAHNADDCAETVLINLCRGSGIKGLSGIQPVRGRIIRPVLCLTRSEIEQYNRDNALEYVTDETNLTEDYTRNKIRLSIMPAITEGINDKAAEHINMTSNSLALIDDYMEQQCKKEFSRIVSYSGDDLHIEAEGFSGLHMAMKWQLVKECLYKVAGKAKDITRGHMDDVIKLFHMQVGKHINLPYGMTAIRQYEAVVIKKAKLNCEEEHKQTVEAVDLTVNEIYEIDIENREANLVVTEDIFHEAIFDENKYTKWIDCDIIGNSLQLRTRRQGDYIVIDKSGSRKKLKDYFIDKKIPKEDRDNVLLVTDGSQVVWIIGHRLSEAYKVTGDSKNILKLHIDIKSANDKMEDI